MTDCVGHVSCRCSPAFLSKSVTFGAARRLDLYSCGTKQTCFTFIRRSCSRQPGGRNSTAASLFNNTVLSSDWSRIVITIMIMRIIIITINDTEQEEQQSDCLSTKSRNLMQHVIMDLLPHRYPRHTHTHTLGLACPSACQKVVCLVAVWLGNPCSTTNLPHRQKNTHTPLNVWFKVIIRLKSHFMCRILWQPVKNTLRIPVCVCGCFLYTCSVQHSKPKQFYIQLFWRSICAALCWILVQFGTKLCLKPEQHLISPEISWSSHPVSDSDLLQPFSLYIMEDCNHCNSSFTFT